MTARVRVTFPAIVYHATRWRQDDERPLATALIKGHAQRTTTLMQEARGLATGSEVERWLDVDDGVVADAKDLDEYDWRRILGLWVLIGSGALDTFRADGGTLNRFDIILDDDD